jgi:hydroxymethylglutaryl-CoA reductase
MSIDNLVNGGLKLDIANTMSENVIGVLSLPLSVIPEFVINKKKIMIPMCVEEPSVVAACSSIGKFIAPFSFFSSSTPNIMIGQVHMPDTEAHAIHNILSRKSQLIDILNSMCLSMVKRGGGVTDLRARRLGTLNSK